jgi:aminoglycoside phosphotransferase (APT) family kinase protein
MAAEVDRLARWLDGRGISPGAELELSPIGDGHSNLTYALSRGDQRCILRRPPAGPVAPTAHDVLREAAWMSALGGLGVRVPNVLAACEDDAVIGAPFFIMERLDGHVPVDSLPAEIDNPADRRALAFEYIDALVELHAVDVDSPSLARFRRSGSYLNRQLDRFSQLWERNRTREIPGMDALFAWLGANRPENEDVAVVHGDARIGNAMFTADSPVRLVALFDWEMAAIGDPLADIGYMLGIWPEPGEEDDPLLVVGQLSRRPGFPTRAELIGRYAESSGRDLGQIRFYEVLALWKSIVLMEGNYARWRRGGIDNDFFATYEQGLPLIAARAGRIAAAEPIRS